MATQTTHHQGLILTRTGYEQSVVARAMARAGNNPHLKGHIHEVLVKDMRNVRNLFTNPGASTELTKSTTAKAVDLVTTKGGKVIERIQVKDVTSKAGIDKLVRQCAEGKYRSAKLVGSEESAKLFNEAAEKAGVGKRMSSTGVSSKTTESLAQRSGATGSGSLGAAVGQAAKTGGLVGAAVSAGVETVKGIIDLKDGTADAVEVAGRVAKAGAKGGTVGAASGAAATLGGAGAAAAVATLGLTGTAAAAVTIGAPIAAAVAVGYVATEAFDAVSDFFSDLF